METYDLKRIVIESKVPFVKGAFERLGVETLYLPAREITADAVKDADALITRTRTRCDASLLAGSRCRMVATATIGTDHIDLPWCASHGIEVANAPGCNAPAVAQYVTAAIMNIFSADPEVLGKLTVGIVGAGHVGSIVDAWCRSLGMRTLLCDPPRAVREGADGFAGLDRIAAEADVITVHTPLTRTPDPYPTYHLVDETFLCSLQRKPLLINSARGPVTDTRALVRAYDSGLIGALAIDCWEREPQIDRGLLQRTTIATPHIAGYSAEGKMRASQAAVDAVARQFGLPQIELECGRAPGWPATVTPASVLSSYDPMADTAALKSEPGAFESLRDNYALRHEPRRP